jgi:hypothetical protein
MDRFWRKVEKTDSCWLWTAAVRRADEGYGAFWLNGRHVPAHRVAFELTNGQIGDDQVVAHRCDNPRCVNPDHLFATTQRGNMEDKVQKGRQAAGERNSKAKLTSSQVAEIRHAYAAGERSIRLAERFGIDRTNVWNIVSGKTWSHSNGP